jgi:predicted Zn-dependent protease with MMP-like domain
MHGSQGSPGDQGDQGSPASSADQRPPARGPRRERRGRGLRGVLAPAAVPVSRTRSELFDDLILDAVEELEQRWTAEVAGVEFAVEEVPPDVEATGADFDPEVVLDRGVALGRLFRSGVGGVTEPVIVIYRRPVEARALDREERGDLVFMIIAELVAELLGREVDED